MLKNFLAALGMTTVTLLVLSMTAIFPIKAILTVLTWTGEDILLGPMVKCILLLTLLNLGIILLIDKLRGKSE